MGRDSTKKLSEFLKLDKEYLAEITLGEERDTDDALGKIVKSLSLSVREDLSRKQVRISHNTKSVRDDKAGIESLPTLSREKVENALKSFVGKHVQIPPEYSAIKVKGKNAYEYARKGISLSLSSRKVVIYSIELIDYSFPVIKLNVKVSSGTYVRSIARDLGRKLGTFAYLSNLKRSQVGKYLIKNALDLDISAVFCFFSHLTPKN